MIKVDFRDMPEADRALLKKMADEIKYGPGNPQDLYHLALAKLTETYWLRDTKTKEA